MAEHSPITALAQNATPIDVRGAADAIGCLVDLIADQLVALRGAVREHGAGAADLHEWHLSEVLLCLAAEQAALVDRSTR
ncbi:MAG: hypothetical protein PGN23_15445 [Sphingomonas adhaesiva]|uniref:hypothetical protein n=1 Tax=Sphingomonas adhaesiva TaxID=28212 RepID=UPI002FFB075A